MRITKILFIVFVLMAIIVGCNKTSTITINEKESFFDEFTVEGEKVYIKCELSINNSYDGSKVVQLSAIFEDDVNLGLLTTKNLIGYDSDLSSDELMILKGQQNMTVTFVGEFGGVNKKHNIKLPPIEIQILK